MLDKNTLAGLCAKNAGRVAYARGGAYLRDTTVYDTVRRDWG